MKISENQILNQIKNIIIGIAPLAKIYLYGSRSRGTAKADSDWDILILLNNDTISADTEQEITSPLYDLEFDIGEVISPMIYSEREWFDKYKFTPLFNNIMRDLRLV